LHCLLFCDVTEALFIRVALYFLSDDLRLETLLAVAVLHCTWYRFCSLHFSFVFRVVFVGVDAGK